MKAGMAPVPSSNKSVSGKQREQRRFARHRTDLPLLVKVLGQDGYIRIHGRCTEIAESGLGAVITAELSAGEMVSLELNLPNGSQLSLRAVIRHRMGFLHGFEFVGLEPEQTEPILAYCQSLPQIP